MAPGPWELPSQLLTQLERRRTVGLLPLEQLPPPITARSAQLRVAAAVAPGSIARRSVRRVLVAALCAAVLLDA
jgi:hypothetical protein